nr:SRPBCC family protein [uncultured Carboxylicivirga sp.]
MKSKELITVEAVINAPIDLVWKRWTLPEHIVNWNFAADTWCCPKAMNDLRIKGELNWRMEAKDGSMGFDYTGTYQQIEENAMIKYEISDGRKVSIEFLVEHDGVRIIETFEAESINSIELQRSGWQAILDNFKRYVESK